MTQFCLVLVTCKSEPEARKIGQALVTQKLAACVNIIPKVNSLFFWDKKLSREREALLLIKTRRKLFSEVSEAIRKSHSYKLPEIIALPFWAGEKKYLNWLRNETRN